MAKSFLKKSPMKGAGGIATKSFIRSAGTVGAAYVANNVLTKVPQIKPALRGPMLFLLGMAGEVLIDNENVRTLAEGITSYGALNTAGELAFKQNKAALGLTGLEGDTMDIPYSESTPAQLQGASEEFDYSQALSGDEDEIGELEEPEISGAKKKKPAPKVQQEESISSYLS